MRTSLFWVMLLAALSSLCIRSVRADKHICLYADSTTCPEDAESPTCCEDIDDDTCCAGETDMELFQSCNGVDTTLVDETFITQAYGGTTDDYCKSELTKGECPSSDLLQITGCGVPDDAARLFARGPRKAKKIKRVSITKMDIDGAVYTLPLNSTIYPAFKATKDKAVKRAIMIAHGTKG